MRSFAGLMILFLGVFASTVGSLGKKLTMVDPEPVMSMAQGVAMPGGIMARLDLFLIAFWIVGVFCVFSGSNTNQKIPSITLPLFVKPP